MDASRYFEEMHRAMSAQKNNSSLLLTVKVQDLGGADAYLELRQSPNGRARVFYSTMGRRNLNFQLFRKGWQLRRAAGTSRSCLPQSAREGAMITVESFVGRGGEWNYWSTRAADCLPIAAILCWLGDFLAGTERRTLQSSPEAMALAARWQAELASPFAQPTDCVQRPARTVSPSAPRRAAQQVQNPRWQSILAVLATV